MIGFVLLSMSSFLVDIHWPAAIEGAFVPTVPQGSLLIIMSVLGAVVMPHNLFLHSEIVQSREIHLEGDERISSHVEVLSLSTLFSL